MHLLVILMAQTSIWHFKKNNYITHHHSILAWEIMQSGS